MTRKLPTKIFNYRVIIEKEHCDDGTSVFSASCPTLGVFDYGDSIEGVLESIRDGIEGTIEFLAGQGREIPVDYLSLLNKTLKQLDISRQQLKENL